MVATGGSDNASQGSLGTMSTGFSSSDEDEVQSLVAVLRMIQDQGHCSALKDCDEELVREIATIFVAHEMKGRGKSSIEDVLECMDINLFDLRESKKRVLHTAVSLASVSETTHLSSPMSPSGCMYAQGTF